MISTVGPARSVTGNRAAQTSAPPTRGPSSLSSHHQAHSDGNHNKSDHTKGGGKQPQQPSTLAPLASLDYSISDPVMSSSTDTPTLSSYFDYDQLSDMIDDSLFEITNAGCLSKSVFVVGHRCSRAPSKMIGQPVLREAPAITMSKDKDEIQQDDGLKTPTNKLPESSPPEHSDQRSQVVAMLANHRGYDYSSTTTVPNQTKASSSGGHRQRSKSARAAAPSLVAAPDRSAINQKVARRKVRSQTDLINGQLDEQLNEPITADIQSTSTNDAADEDDEPDSLCPACRRSQIDEPVGGNKRAKQKKRFTFSLFNLFTSSGPSSSSTTSSSMQYDKEKCCCPQKRDRQILGHQGANTNRHGLSSSTTIMNHRHKPPVRQENSKGRLRNGSSNSSSGPIRSRDSIKLINQRKLRNNGAATTNDDASTRQVRGCHSIADFQERLRDSEILLDLSQPDTRPNHVDQPNDHPQPLRMSQSSYAFGSSNWSSDPSSRQHQDFSQSMLSRQTKSVKFTTPDRVMILPGLGKFSKYSSNLPPADLQPAAPIIKNRNQSAGHSVTKSSTYSQTDSSKNLDELLAKFEQNSQLITDINEKLKLTETIASPKSALDQQSSLEETTVDNIVSDQSLQTDIKAETKSNDIPSQAEHAVNSSDQSAEQNTKA